MEEDRFLTTMYKKAVRIEETININNQVIDSLQISKAATSANILIYMSRITNFSKYFSYLTVQSQLTECRGKKSIKIAISPEVVLIGLNICREIIK